MTGLIDAAVSWPTLLIALVIFGAAPNLVLRLLLLAYPKGHPQRTAIWADFRDVPRWERPFWSVSSSMARCSKGCGNGRRPRHWGGPWSRRWRRAYRWWPPPAGRSPTTIIACSSSRMS